MTDVDTAIQRAIECGAMLYNTKAHVLDNERDIELRFLYSLAKNAPGGPAVEVGVASGGSLVCWASARQTGPIYGVDNWDGAEKRYAKAKNAIALYPDLPEITLVRCLSWEAPARLGRGFSFAFIDACHGDGGIDRDLTVWPDAIAPGGTLAFHDYGTRKGTVRQHVDTWLQKARWPQIGVVGSLIAFRRPA